MSYGTSSGREARTVSRLSSLIGWAALFALVVGPLGAFDLATAQRFQLDNGLTLIVLEVPEAPAVSVQMLYRVGARHEEVGQTGVTHFLEHMAFRASANFPDTELVSSIYAVGGEWHGYTWLDQTTYFETLPADQLDLALQIEADRMARLEIPAAEVEAERGAVLAEMHGYENDPATVLHDAVLAVAFLQHPYRNNTIGWESDVENISHDELVEFYRRAYSPANAVLAVVGPVSAGAVLEQVRGLFGDVPGGESMSPPPTVEPPQQGVRRIELLGPASRKIFKIAYHAPSVSDPDYPAFLLAQQVLAGGRGVNFGQNEFGDAALPTSRLAGIADDLATWYPPQAAPYVFTIGGSIGADVSTADIENAAARGDRRPDRRAAAGGGNGDGPPPAPRRTGVRPRDHRGRGPPARLLRRSGRPRCPPRTAGAAGRGHCGRCLAGRLFLPPPRPAHHRVVPPGPGTGGPLRRRPGSRRRSS